MKPMKPSQSAQRLSELIKKAIDDHRITNSEYDEILSIVDEDGVTDPQEKRILAELHDMIANKSIQRVP